MNFFDYVSAGLKRLPFASSANEHTYVSELKACATAEAATSHGKTYEQAGEPAIAAQFYRRALELDPATTDAITGLGRIEYREPAQPFLSEIRARGIPPFCEVIMEIRNPCNYRCFYCVAKGFNNEPVKEFDLDAIDRTLNQIEAEAVYISLECGGGEPTIHPQFPELARICAKRGILSFPSNNSQDPARWLPREYADRIGIRCAVHPETETKTGLDRYIRHARYLMEAGVGFESVFISHPTRISKIPEYRDLFSEHGVPFRPIPFIGEYEGRSYPHAHTEEERTIIGISGPDDGDWYDFIQPHVNRIRNFRGISCHAGFRSLYVTRDGSVRRCLYDARKLPGPLERPEPCAVKNCGCGMLLEKLNQHFDWPLSYNAIAPKHLPRVDVTWMESAAKRLGYDSPYHAMATEQIRMYDELMRAHGKDEFPESAKEKS